MKLAIRGKCLCKAVEVGAAQVPRQVTQCNCTVCRRYGTLWAYYQRAELTITARRGALERYSRRTNGLRFVRCKRCGCMIYWDHPGKGKPDHRIGINTRLFDHALMAKVPVKVLDGDKTWKVLDEYVKPEMWISPSRKRPAKPRSARRARR